jgi:hypothetical protein
VGLDSQPEIEVAAKELLGKAGAMGSYPTPVDDIVAAASLTEPSESLLGESVLGQAPKYLRAVMQRLGGRILGLLDRRTREVHLDPAINLEGRRRFIRLHEAGHDSLPWQGDLAFADNSRTLSPQVRQLWELEANSFAAEVMFQGNRLAEDAADLQIGLAAVIDLHDRFGASLRSTFWRYAERNGDTVAGIVLGHQPESIEPVRFQRHELIRSSRFAARFGADYWPSRLDGSRFGFVDLAAAATSTPQNVVAGMTQLTDVNGEYISLQCEALCTGFNTLVLLWLPRSERLRKRLRLVS